jgi:hypothetical protein
MSYKNWASVLKAVEAQKGSFNVVPHEKSTEQYGWEEMVIGSVTGQRVKFVAVQELDDDVIMGIDWRALKFHSNGFFRKMKSPDGLEYYTLRDETQGYQFIIDICLFGALVVVRPSYCFIILSIDY